MLTVSVTKRKEKREREVLYFILSFTASFFSLLDTLNKNMRKKKKVFFCLYFIKLTVNRQSKKKKKSAAIDLFLYKSNINNHAKSDWMCSQFFRRSTKRSKLDYFNKEMICFFLERLSIQLHMLLQVWKVWHYWILIRVYRQIEQFIVKRS